MDTKTKRHAGTLLAINPSVKGVIRLIKYMDLEPHGADIGSWRVINAAAKHPGIYLPAIVLLISSNFSSVRSYAPNGM